MDPSQTSKYNLRSSLKKKSINPLEISDECLPSACPPRRVSFAASSSIKPFLNDPEQNTIWDNTYEESINANSGDSKGNLQGMKSTTHLSDMELMCPVARAVTLYEGDMDITCMNLDKNQTQLDDFDMSMTCKFTLPEIIALESEKTAGSVSDDSNMELCESNFKVPSVPKVKQYGNIPIALDSTNESIQEDKQLHQNYFDKIAIAVDTPEQSLQETEEKKAKGLSERSVLSQSSVKGFLKKNTHNATQVTSFSQTSLHQVTSFSQTSSHLKEEASPFKQPPEKKVAIDRNAAYSVTMDLTNMSVALPNLTSFDFENVSGPEIKMDKVSEKALTPTKTSKTHASNPTTQNIQYFVPDICKNRKTVLKERQETVEWPNVTIESKGLERVSAYPTQENIENIVPNTSKTREIVERSAAVTTIGSEDLIERHFEALFTILSESTENIDRFECTLTDIQVDSFSTPEEIQGKVIYSEPVNQATNSAYNFSIPSELEGNTSDKNSSLNETFAILQSKLEVHVHIERFRFNEVDLEMLQRPITQFKELVKQAAAKLEKEPIVIEANHSVIDEKLKRISLARNSISTTSDSSSGLDMDVSIELTLDDKIQEFFKRTEVLKLKRHEEDFYIFSTYGGFIWFAVNLHPYDGRVTEIRSRIIGGKDDSPIRMVNEFILKDLKNKMTMTNLRSSLGVTFDMLSLLDHMVMVVDKCGYFFLAFIKTQFHHRSLEFIADNTLFYEIILSGEKHVWWTLKFQMSSIEKINPDSLQVESKWGSINKDHLDTILLNTEQGVDMIGRFIKGVLEYFERTQLGKLKLKSAAQVDL